MSLGGYDTSNWPVLPRLTLQHQHGKHAGRYPTMHCPLCEVHELRAHLRAVREGREVRDTDRIVADEWGRRVPA